MWGDTCLASRKSFVTIVGPLTLSESCKHWVFMHWLLRKTLVLFNISCLKLAACFTFEKKWLWDTEVIVLFFTWKVCVYVSFCNQQPLLLGDRRGILNLFDEMSHFLLGLKLKMDPLLCSSKSTIIRLPSHHTVQFPPKKWEALEQCV